jgi:hypothetical protein
MIDVTKLTHPPHHSVKLIQLGYTILSTLYNLLSTHLLKVHLREMTSQRSAMIAFCSLTMTYNSQYWIVKLVDPNHISSRNLILTPFSTFHLCPILAILAAHITPYQKLDAPKSLQDRMLGLVVLYLKSIKAFQTFPSSLEYLLI